MSDIRRALLLVLPLAASTAALAVEGGEYAAGASATGEDGRVVQTWNTTRAVSRAQSGPGIDHLGPTTGQGYISANEDPEGDMPRDVAYTPDGSEVVVVHRDTDNVTFFDAATRVPTHTVPVGDFPVHLAVTPDGRYVVVPNVFDNTVTVIDVASHSVAATIDITGQQPYQVGITPDGAYAVVGVINDGVSSTFSLIDLSTMAEIRTYAGGSQGAFGGFFTPEPGISGNIFTQFAVSPTADKVVLADRANARVRIYDALTGTELASLPVTDLPTALDISDDGTVAVVSHESSYQTITKIDLVSNTVSGAFSTNDSLSSQVIRITPDKSHAMAAISNNVIFVNLTNGVTTATISTGVVGDIEISADGQYAFVSNYNARVISIASQSLVKTMSFAACANSAASPVENRAVALNNRFREDIHFYDIDGAAGFFEGYANSGEPEEGDATYGVDISADGSVAVACNVVSRNVSVFDMATNTVRSYVEVGERPKEVRITPDGNYAVVCAMDANAVKIIDLNTDTVVKSLSIYERPGRVRISPDGQYAYVLNVAGTDRISFIQLDGADSYIISQANAGQTGSANGPTYTETSGIELSPDGSILAVCDSFNDLLRLFDTATRTQVAAVPVGDFPLRVAFLPDGSRAYVTNHFSDSVSVVVVDGSDSYLLTTVTGISKYPLTVDSDGDGSYVYVGTRYSGGGSNAIRVINTATNSVVRTVSFGDGYPRDTFLSPTDSVLYAGVTDSRFVLMEAAGAASAIVEDLAISSSPSDIAFSDAVKRAVVSQPIPDGLDVIWSSIYGDVNSDGVVDIDDVFAILADWGPCDDPSDCPADVNGDENVDIDDLFEVLANWT